MKNLFVLLTFSIFLATLYSFDSNKKANKLIGSWKVLSIVKSKGGTKKGRKIITFSKDGTFISVKDTGSKMTGFWELEKDELRVFDESKENIEKSTVVKLTRKKLILKDDRGIYTLAKVQ